MCIPLSSKPSHTYIRTVVLILHEVWNMYKLFPWYHCHAYPNKAMIKPICYISYFPIEDYQERKKEKHAKAQNTTSINVKNATIHLSWSLPRSVISTDHIQRMIHINTSITKKSLAFLPIDVKQFQFVSAIKSTRRRIWWTLPNIK